MKIFRLMYVVFLLIGIGMLIGSIVTYMQTRAFIAGAERSEGKVIEVQYGRRAGDSTGMYCPVFQFITKEGHTIRVTSKIRSSSPDYHRGEKVTVFYDPKEPNNAVIKGFMNLYFLPMVFGLIGVGFTGFGAGMAGWDILRNGKPAYYRRHGKFIEATVKGISRANYEVKYVRPWRIDAEWQDPTSGRLFQFQSQNLYVDPAEHLRDHRTLGVYIKASNPKRYWMDISFLKEG
jgi:hypothetical protein